jgi:uncharacterized protein (UPF0218 family)
MHSSAKYSLPSSYREILKEPIGILVSEEGLFDILSKETKVVSIGDQVTYTLLCKNIFPLFCIIDYQIKRKENIKKINDKLCSYGKIIKNVVNPPGVITYDLWSSIEDAYGHLDKGIPLRIEVTGEEDLAALPAILLAPKNVTIIYGLPDRGVVVVPSTEEHKQKVKEILAKM